MKQTISPALRTTMEKRLPNEHTCTFRKLEIYKLCHPKLYNKLNEIGSRKTAPILSQLMGERVGVSYTLKVVKSILQSSAKIGTFYKFDHYFRKPKRRHLLSCNNNWLEIPQMVRRLLTSPK